MDLDSIMFSEINQRKTNIVCFHLRVESKKQNRRTNTTKQKQTHRYRDKLVVTREEKCGKGREGGK